MRAVLSHTSILGRIFPNEQLHDDDDDEKLAVLIFIQLLRTRWYVNLLLDDDDVR